ncbi:DNA gyrase subunit A [Natroniella acetigena]|uniref:DNA gyrase subunit A n=1 Tax=Natroniella acetigena TaxID=52004 RepID=UPI00200B034B|nr:DNA gyrase subunit A [Natroniella acetigena]MCK8826829.1 DNA gyrase subunit A [Natroniella acetigena]
MEELNDSVKIVGIEDEMQEAYIDYAMSVIVGRALPDVRDGLKPVHRRILYAMNELGMKPTQSHKKSARIVGEVLGKYHPHGDTAVYDTMVRMAQDFSYRYQLVDGHGNFGSIDGDSAAAMRYTEARMTSITTELLLDINKETVDFSENFDGTLQEPEVLPARVPNLLINGSSGIAVGMSTNIPPHNIKEVIDGVIELINNPELEITELMKIIKGPDFPTGGNIMGRKAIKKYFETGRGKIKLRAETKIKELNNEKNQIIITELPYQVNKAKLIKKIARLVREDKIEGIADLRDESDREGMRVVIELKQGANPRILLNKLYKHTRLQTTFGIIMLALVDKQPEILGIKDVLKYYVNHQKDVITRRTRYDLNKATVRAHILEGFKIALDNIERAIKIIRSSKNSSLAQKKLKEEFELSKKQAKAILNMRLHRLTNLERDKIEVEYKELQQKIEYLESILASEDKLLSVIKEELIELKDKYSDGRRTKIIDKDIDLDLEDLIEEQEIIITLTEEGYIKRMPLDTYRNQHRGGKGIIGIKTKENDTVQNIYTSSTHDYILFFTNRGRVYRLKGYQLPETGRQARGTAIINLLELDANEKITTVMPISEFGTDQYLVMATKQGIIKKTKLEEYNTNYTGLIALNLLKNDKLIDVKLINDRQEIILATKQGLAIRFSEQDVRSIGRTARGVKGISLEEGDQVIGMEIVKGNKELLVITEKGYGKRTPLERYRTQSRGGKGLITLNRTDNNGCLVEIKVVDGDEEIIIISEEGILLRTSVSEISCTGRNTQGVRVMKLNEDDKVASIGYVD